jgi:N-acetylglucosaminyldiphosphoundecaprenol N-acetyl-beta-D-mannosaminyltransferase
MKKVRLFGIAVDPVRVEEAAQGILSMARTAGRCRYVVTPNVDHILILEKNEGLRRAYADAAMVVADGWPVVVASRLLGQPLPERVAGSDLVPAVLAAAPPTEPLRVYLLGAAPGVAERAARNIEKRWAGVRVVGAYGPPFGFERDAAENAAILRRIDDARPELLLVGLGAPKQELWVHAHRDKIAARVALCIGATIDFLADEKPRAPGWVRRIGLEWFHRMASEPRRLVPRYATNAVVFPRLFLREWRSRKMASGV